MYCVNNYEVPLTSNTSLTCNIDTGVNENVQNNNQNIDTLVHEKNHDEDYF